MKKLFILSLAFLFSLGLKAQEPVYTGSDDKVSYKVTVEKYSDKVNDRYNEYYALEITNKTNNSVKLTPVFNYRIDEGELLKTSSRDDDQSITLAPGETIKGDYKSLRKLVLFKQFLIGKSGKKASNTTHSLDSVTINY